MNLQIEPLKLQLEVNFLALSASQSGLSSEAACGYV